jgi:hypothetical protein
MDMSGSEDNNNSKSKLSYFCSGLSIASSIFTLLIAIKKKNVAKDMNQTQIIKDIKNIIVINLCISLLIVNLMVILLVDRTDTKVRINLFLKE